MTRDDEFILGETLDVVSGDYKGKWIVITEEDLQDIKLHGRVFCVNNKGHEERIAVFGPINGENAVLPIHLSDLQRRNSYKFKFKIGDKVKVIKGGSGCSEIGTIVTITGLGKYSDGLGYTVEPKIGNSKTGAYGGMIGESSFELYVEKTEAGVLLSDLKEGDIVEVLNTANVRSYKHFEINEVVGKQLIISKEDVHSICNVPWICPEKNKYRTSFRNGDFKIISRRDTPVIAKFPFTHKFKVGDRVKAVIAGNGVAPDETDIITTIVELGTYCDKAGYRVDEPKIGNSKDGSYPQYKGMIGEVSFELVPPIPETPSPSIPIVKGNKLTDLREEDVIRILDTPNVRRWWNGKKAIGQTETIRREQAEDIKSHKHSKGYELPLGDNLFGINYKNGDFEIISRVINITCGGGAGGQSQEEGIASYKPIVGILKGMYLSELIDGDIVEVLDTPNVQRYIQMHAPNSIGKKISIKRSDLNRLKTATGENRFICPEDNKYYTNFKDGDFKLVRRVGVDSTYDVNKEIKEAWLTATGGSASHTSKSDIGIAQAWSNVIIHCGNELYDKSLMDEMQKFSHEYKSSKKTVPLDQYFEKPVIVTKSKLVKKLKLV